jgi:hypothetical protein
MLADPALPYPQDDDAGVCRRPALWRARPPRLTVAAMPLLVLLLLWPFWGIALLFLLDPNVTPASSFSVNGFRIALDPQTARALYYAQLALFLGWPFYLAGSALIRQLRLRYRLDGEAVETWRGARLLRRIELGEIRSLTDQPLVVLHRVHVRRTGRGGIALYLRAADARNLVEQLQRFGVEPEAAAAPIPAIAPEETVHWQGRPGFAALDRFQLAAGLLLFLPVLIYAWPLYWLWGTGLPLVALLLGAYIWTWLWGGLAVGMLISMGMLLTRWIREAFGTLLVTDRRLAWREPGSTGVYREIARSELVDAAIVEQKGRRAWVALTIRKGADDVEEMDLRGITQADRFVAALGFGA